MHLDDLPNSQPAQVRAISPDDQALEAALREVGFAENDEVEILHRGAFGKKPLCVRLNQTLIALRTDEAHAVTVEVMAR